MPIYELECKDCNTRFEAKASYDDKPVCPKCGSENTRKAIVPFTHYWNGCAPC